jgi:hypothetical protein
MTVPTFRTRIKDIETRVHATEVFADFIDTFTRKELFEAAEGYVANRCPNGSVYTFRNMPGGLMRHVIGLIIMNSTDSTIVGESEWLEGRLMEHYEFTAESIPPRMLVREAVALRVRLGTVLADLERELAVGAPKEHAAVVREVAEAARGLESPEEAYRLSNEEAGAILRRM